MAENAERVWIENTTSQFDHGGEGWEFGTCVWCPAKDKRGSLGRYKIIEEVKAGDRVINCYDGLIRGTSKVRTDSYTTTSKPPKAGPWAYASSFLRFDLSDFMELPKPAPLRRVIEKFKDEISEEIESSHPPYNLFSWWPRSQYYPEGRVVLSQGRFLAKATPLVCKLIAETAGIDPKTFASE